MESKDSYKQSPSGRCNSFVNDSFVIFEIINIKTIDMINQPSKANHKLKEKGFNNGVMLCCSYFSL